MGQTARTKKKVAWRKQTGEEGAMADSGKERDDTQEEGTKPEDSRAPSLPGQTATMKKKVAWRKETGEEEAMADKGKERDNTLEEGTNQEDSRGRSLF